MSNNTIAFFSALALVGFSSGCQSPRATPGLAPAAIADADWMTQVVDRTAAAGRAFRPVAGGFAARNERFEFDVRVDAAGLGVQHGDDDVRLAFTGWGRDGVWVDALASTPTTGGCGRDGAVLPDDACARELVMDRGGGVTEWVENTAAGPEQGWVLETRQEGDGPVVLELRVDGATASGGDGEVRLVGAAGGEYRYSSLLAWDAEGRALDAWFEVSAGTVSIVVDDHAAAWPITVDPVLDTTEDVTLSGAATSGYFGISVAGAGDVNGDGDDDVIVGSSYEDAGAGAARVYFGGATMDSVADVTFTAVAADGYMGRCVASAGDLDRDGYADVLVGSPNEASGTGAVRVYLGGAAMDAVEDLTFVGAAAGDTFGRSAARAGDVNADGYEDIVIGAFGENASAGSARIYLGGASFDTVADVTILGAASPGELGRSVATAGDVNADGFADVIVGAYLENAEAGVARLYYGGAVMDEVADVEIAGGAAGDRLGYSVSGAGDVDGDGFADVLVGAYKEGGGMGAARVYLGGAAMDAVADVTILGTAANAQLGESVARLGDVDGDGADDFLVGAFNESSGLGAARVYLGGAALDEVADLEMLGSDPSPGYYGYSVAGAGDVNGDGGQDIIVGAYNESAGLGTARIYFGTSGPAADDTAADTGGDDADEGEDEDEGDDGEEGDDDGCGDGDGHGGHGGGHTGHGGGHGGHGGGQTGHGGGHTGHGGGQGGHGGHGCPSGHGSTH